jgi:hypothetical protein
MSRPKRQRRSDTEERLKRENERLRRELAERQRQIAEQAKRIADLERQLALRNQNSTITSKPPASDGLAGRQRLRGRRRKSRRKPGRATWTSWSLATVGPARARERDDRSRARPLSPLPAGVGRPR